MAPDAPPPAGWYPDPGGTGGRRWWTGSEWSDAVDAAPVEDRDHAALKRGIEQVRAHALDVSVQFDVPRPVKDTWALLGYLRRLPELLDEVDAI